MNDTIPHVRHEGDILLDGEGIYRPEEDVSTLRQRVGMVFQRWNPFPKSIYDNVAYGPRINGVTNKAELDKMREALNRASEVNAKREAAINERHMLAGVTIVAPRPSVLQMPDARRRTSVGNSSGT